MAKFAKVFCLRVFWPSGMFFIGVLTVPGVATACTHPSTCCVRARSRRERDLRTGALHMERIAESPCPLAGDLWECVLMIIGRSILQGFVFCEKVAPDGGMISTTAPLPNMSASSDPSGPTECKVPRRICKSGAGFPNPAAGWGIRRRILYAGDPVI